MPRKDGNEGKNDSEDPRPWRVGFKVAWDVQTPPVVCSVRDKITYLMLGDFNDTHQHCVLTGVDPRFSATFRVALSDPSTTIQGIRKLLDDALSPDGESWQNEEDLSRAMKAQDVAEFEWIRQFWSQGRQHAKHRPEWEEKICSLELSWFCLEKRLIRFLEEKQTGKKDEKMNTELFRRIKARLCLRIQWKKRYQTCKQIAQHEPIQRPISTDDRQQQSQSRICNCTLRMCENKMKALPYDLSKLLHTLGG